MTLETTAAVQPFPARAAETLDDVRHLVELGFPRSGTSLLMNALAEHSQIAMLDEELRGGIRNLAGSKVRGIKLCVPNQVQLERKWTGSMKLHPVYRFLRLTGHLPKSTWRNTRPRSRWSIRDYAALPNTTFVCLLRDPARSLDAVRRRQGLETPTLRAMWHLFIETMTAIDSMPSHPAIFVSFERLIREPEAQLGALCKRLDLPFEENMLLGPRFNRRYPGRKFDASKAETRDIPNADELGLSAAALAEYTRLLDKAI